jgi:dipeptidyl aminopeptidase/acylaminoacyl peptidase
MRLELDGKAVTATDGTGGIGLPTQFGAIPQTAATSVVSSDGARVSILVHRPSNPRGWLVWAHGGSWQYGSAGAWAPVTAALAVRSTWRPRSLGPKPAPSSCRWP